MIQHLEVKQGREEEKGKVFIYGRCNSHGHCGCSLLLVTEVMQPKGGRTSDAIVGT